MLLVRRGRPPRLGEWSLPGGAQRLGERAEEAARLNARWRGWAYQVGQWKEKAFLPRLSDLAKQPRN